MSMPEHSGARPPLPTGKREDAPATPARKTSRPWLWVIAVFVLQLAAWSAWFTIAARHKVQEVPLAPSQ